ncbi:MAG TPA: GNAT family N-acetyltransferase [Candidatus Hydrogenedentes bacterium]|nr:GNAT family N-acetyltransferase [Candidatus Hydrogenedentota bacterium]
MRIILNLIDYYIYDMSKSAGWECNAEGRFAGCDDSREYWQTHHPETQPSARWPEGRRGHPFIVRSPSGVAGFALIREMGDDPDVDYDMAEFFIVGKYQRRGIGRHVACAIFDMFRGRWSVRQLVANIPAKEFWKAVVSDYTKGHFTESCGTCDGWDMVYLTFDNT